MPNRFNILRPDRTKLKVDTDASDDQLNGCLEKIRAAWMHLGIVNPHYSVLARRDFLPENLGDSIDAFYASGEEEAAVVENILVRHDCSTFSEKVCVEYGTGVGRVTLGLARRFAWVYGYDISSGHLSHAVERAKEIGLTNISFHLYSENFLTPLHECDVAYSRIVFQHNPPPLQSRLIKNFLEALKPGGMAIFQVLTYMKDFILILLNGLESAILLICRCIAYHSKNLRNNRGRELHPSGSWRRQFSRSFRHLDVKHICGT